MSVGALSPEAHQALTIGIQRAGGAANTGEGGEDPAWYAPGADGRRHDARSSRSPRRASASPPTTSPAPTSSRSRSPRAPSRARAASCPAARPRPHRRAAARPGRPELHQPAAAPRHLLDRGPRPADRRPARDQPGARGSASSSSRAAASGRSRPASPRPAPTYIHLSRPLGRHRRVAAVLDQARRGALGARPRRGPPGPAAQRPARPRRRCAPTAGCRPAATSSSPRSSGAEEYGFGTAALVAIGCDMARQCHLDTCPTGIATQREDLRAKFTGTPEMVVRFFTAIAEDVRRELAAVGARSVGEVVGESAAAADRRPGRPRRAGAGDRRRRRGAPSAGRRADPAGCRHATVRHAPGVAAGGRASRRPFRGQGSVTGRGPRALTTADRSFGAGTHRRPRARRARAARSTWRCAARPASRSGRSRARASSCGSSARPTTTSARACRAARSRSSPEPDLAATPSAQAIAGNTVLYGATGGRLHLVGRAGMRFAVRNSGAEAVVEGIGPHGCEYMTGGTVVVLGPVGANLGAGMTGGRAYLYDPTAGTWRRSPTAASRPSGWRPSSPTARTVRRGSPSCCACSRRIARPVPRSAGRLLDDADLPAEMWVVEPVAARWRSRSRPPPAALRRWCPAPRRSSRPRARSRPPASRTAGRQGGD